MHEQTTSPTVLPDIREIGLKDPLNWLALGWKDMMSAPAQTLTYGLVLALVSGLMAFALFFSGAVGWIMILAGGFFFLAPMIAMGLYEAGRQIEAGEKPTLKEMIFVKTASTRDLAYLGLALLVIYFFWSRMAQLIYALSTYTIHKTVQDFLVFMFTTPEGHAMAMTGTVAGGCVAFIAFCLIVISAPMLLDRKADVFIATVTSFRAVMKNPCAMILWAVIIACLTAIGIATAFLGLIIIFPWIGLSTWHAYRSLVVQPS